MEPSAQEQIAQTVKKQQTYDQLLDLIVKVVHDNSEPWPEKEQNIRERAEETGKSIELEEFTEWFV